MTRRLALLVGSCLALWLVSAYPTSLWGGEQAVVFSAVAMGICLVPTALTLGLALWAGRSDPAQQALFVLAGTGIRMMLVLLATLILNTNFPYFQSFGFLVWVLVYYLFTLTLEVSLLIAARPAADE